MFLLLICELNLMCMGVYVAFGSIFPAGLGSEWEENVHVKSEPEVGKGAQGQHMDIRQADITKPWQCLRGPRAWG